MKRIFLLPVFAIILLCTGCNLTKTAQAYYDNHCKGTLHKRADGKNELIFECDSLYKTATIQKHFPEAIVSFDIAKAKLYGDVVSIDTPSIATLMKLLKK